MSWRPRKRKMASGRTVWVARYKDDHGQIRLAKPAWNGGKGTFELKRKAQRAIDEAIQQRLPEPPRQSASTSSGGWRRTRGRSGPIGPTPAGSATCCASNWTAFRLLSGTCANCVAAT